jgi:hypothetical protein
MMTKDELNVCEVPLKGIQFRLILYKKTEYLQKRIFIFEFNV